MHFVHIHLQSAIAVVDAVGLDLLACHIGPGFEGNGRILKMDAANNLGERNRRAATGSLVFLGRDILARLVVRVHCPRC
jgi:hypothetical protein